MSTKTSALKRAASAFKKAMGPQRYGVHGKSFICQFCGHDRFKKRDGGVSIFGLSGLTCAECSHVEFFNIMPPVLDDDAA
jgi:hypothetical protein